MFKAQNHSLNEVASLLRRGEIVSPDPASSIRLAEWLEELARSRIAIYDAQVALAKVELCNAPASGFEAGSCMNDGG